MSALKIEAPQAYAWEIQGAITDGKKLLCRWAQPTKEGLIGEEAQPTARKPSPEAEPVLVRIIREGDYRKLLKAAKEADGSVKYQRGWTPECSP